MRGLLAVVLIACLALCSCQGGNRPDGKTKGDEKMQIEVTSSAFVDDGMIPSKYTSDGADVSPPLAWDAVPTGAKTIALICDDPDAPAKVWVHWVLFNLPASIKELPEDIRAEQTLDSGARQGTNDSGRIGYSGPCPPSGVHRYCFKLYSLDAELGLHPGAKKPQLLEAMKGHVLAEGQLTGKYSRGR